MKNQLISAVVIAILSTTLQTANAASCHEDILQMRAEIKRWGSIESADAHRFHTVEGSLQTSENVCNGNGYYDGSLTCKITWTVGDWGDTLRCKWEQ